MRVKSVKKVHLEEAVPVYDLSVPEFQNFKLAAGPFVHNSKDCADAIAGVIYGLTTRRELWAMYDIPTIAASESVRAAIERDDEAKPKVT